MANLLAKKSQLLITFGVSSAPELFQQRINQVLEGLSGVLCLMDDVLVFGETQDEHDRRLKQVMEKLESTGVTLNVDKCEFSRDTLKFLGHIVDKNGIRPDLEKTRAIIDMEPPQTVTDLRRFLGMANQLGKFSCGLSDLSQPLRKLLKKKNAGVWGPDQEKSLLAIKEELIHPTTLVHYNSTAHHKISADASSFGLRSVLLQEEDKMWKPVVYASRTLTETENIIHR